MREIHEACHVINVVRYLIKDVHLGYDKANIINV